MTATRNPRNFRKNPHTARWLQTFHNGDGTSHPAEILADGTPVDSDGNVWVSPEDRAAMDFLTSDVPATEYVAPEPVKAATTSSRPAAGYLVDFQGHPVRCGEGFVSEAQAKWIVDLLVTREITGADNTFIRLEQGFAKSAGSAFITANKNAPCKSVEVAKSASYAEAVAPGASTEELVAEAVPAGRYALRTDGVVKFYRLDKPTQGKWAGWTFLKAQASDDLYPIRNKVEKARIIAEIGQDVLGAERLYGMELGKCSRCGRSLTDETSRAYGIGPDCRNK